MKLTPAFFENNKNWIRLKDDARPNIVWFESNTEHIRKSYPKWDKYVTVTFNVDNLTGGHGVHFRVHFHMDNGDFDTIASFDVKTVEQANQILGVYNIRLDEEGDLYFDPTWAGDVVIAEFALPIIKSLACKTNAYPPYITWKEWRKILGSIIFSLHQVQHDHMTENYDWFVKKYGPKQSDYWPKWEEYHDRIQKGLENFGKYFMCLNW